MGWQGRMRNAKGYRYFLMLPESVRRNQKFVQADAFRDDKMVWIEICEAGGLEGGLAGQSGRLIRMERSSGKEFPLALGLGSRRLRFDRLTGEGKKTKSSWGG